jgi:prepilin signal peptidase PulO-like enzyme (type II secretory pathway)
MEMSMVRVVVAVFALVGLLIGSAINAMVWRLYVGRSWVRGRSECPDCGHKLAAKDLVPVVSWLWLRGRCRYCGQRIHWQYPVVEALTAGLFGLSAWALVPVGAVTGAGMNAVAVVQFGFWLVLLTMLVVLAVYDLRWLLLPDKVMVPLMVVALVYAVTMAGLHAWVLHDPGAWRMLLGPLVAAVGAGGAFYALVALSKGRAMGGGDIKLAFAMGLMLGLQGTAAAMLLAFNVAAIVGVVLIATKKRGRRDQIPFGPFLVGGTVVAFLWGRMLVEWYLRINGVI